jgi:hypothetical protein
MVEEHHRVTTPTQRAIEDASSPGERPENRVREDGSMIGAVERSFRGQCYGELATY